MTTMTDPLVHDHEFGTPWTIDDLKGLPDDALHRFEIYDGSLLVSPTAGTFHGTVTHRLLRILIRQGPDDLLIGQVGGISREMTSYFVPDLFVIPDRFGSVDHDAFNPKDVLLVVEVLSPSNARQDLVLKRDEYGRSGIPLYWIVDPQKWTMTVLELADDGTYQEAAVVEPGQVWRTDRPFPLAFDLAELF